MNNNKTKYTGTGTNIEQAKKINQHNILQDEYGNSIQEEDNHPERNPDVGQSGRANAVKIKDKEVMETVGEAITDIISDK
ncbi:MAG: hypothetical protein K0R49_1836 [Burkholderiales bacterium]|jgi:hypothetical protein|nr:hypothetical protein [Burkholderiales bacterium]